MRQSSINPPQPAAATAFRTRLKGRTVVSKMARFDPDKRWRLTIDTVGAMKRAGWRPLLIARGGVEAHGAEVLSTARARGLRMVERALHEPGVPSLLHAVSKMDDADIVSLGSPVDPPSRQLLFHSSDAVLANRGREPFGLVGLETMAAGGLACTGCSGEDYAIAGHNALVLETRRCAGVCGLVWRSESPLLPGACHPPSGACDGAGVSVDRDSQACSPASRAQLGPPTVSPVCPQSGLTSRRRPRCTWFWGFMVGYWGRCVRRARCISQKLPRLTWCGER